MDIFSSRYHTLFTLALLAITFTFSTFSFAQDESKTIPTSRTEQELKKINKELKELSDTLAISSGETTDALQLKLFQKNEELRAVLATAVNRGSLPEKELITQIELQKDYSKSATDYLEQQIKELNVKIDSAKNEERLSLINDYQELQHYLNTVTQSSWQNIKWLQTLGLDESIGEKQLRVVILQRLRLTSATVEYLNQQIGVIGKQLSVSPESEKSGLQLSQLVIKQRMSIAIKSLSTLISVADQLAIDTSDYKRLMFEITGSITQDLLDGKVVLTILSHWSNSTLEWLGTTAPHYLFQLLIFALLILSTRVVVKLVRQVIKKTVSSKNLNLSQLMQNFFIGISGNIVWIIGIMIALAQLGLNLAPVLTGFGIAGVIIGFALQDTLSNFAAGMMLLIYRPFDVGDFVFAGSVDGKVSHMSLVNTTIKTFDNQIIIIPNGKIWGDVIKNVTHERLRRVDMVFGIGYADDLLKAEKILTEIVTAHPATLKNPEPNIRVHTLNTSSVDFIVRPWVKTDDYWDVYWDITKEVKLTFDREGISIPFPQQDVHLHMVEKSES
ncbi:mechanosensitive ion channel family protein [Vibrio breoganii]|uniref:mechanosensitive ion channel family protein n=1 Tax=Vibrio breoganii TaxID=553239 RepID=UPI0003097D43|nr:mechanosensitive ion channel family protein [Vibrio breoganii]OEF83342.1 mechanosensitive ion channel protein MscS [Vibrio breoganii 1C10]PMG91621.1 mechanosensitive ion channel protein MscS [Vibrio breoganii]PMH15299.1 mechanosensitive ion channel protein MscS [Vibrio breoganii]PMJ50045.1 mechanosensitive ion channel protein MscS [Vibrio breoganii]PMK52850.1 mechanosensitive ion channel protein MscS [Vibrio breoganii]